MSGLLYKSTSLAYFYLLAAFQKKQQQKKMTNAHFGGGIGQLGIDLAIMIY